MNVQADAMTGSVKEKRAEACFSDDVSGDFIYVSGVHAYCYGLHCREKGQFNNLNDLGEPAGRIAD